jgi:hypothetical protein
MAENVGDQAFQVRGLRMDGTWRFREPMKCPLCRKPEVYIDHNSDKSRVLICHDCLGVGVISKGKNRGPWWYHDWKHISKLPAAFLASAYDRGAA